MSWVALSLARLALVSALVLTAIAFERRTGEIPNLAPILGLLAGVGLGALTGTILETAIGLAALGAPAILAYRVAPLRSDAAKFALGLGACLGPVGAGVALSLGALWIVGLARREAAWKRAERRMPRLMLGPRVAVLAWIGSITQVIVALAWR